MEDRLVLRALRAAWLLIATDPEPRPRLGFVRPKAFDHYLVTDYWTLFSLARELGMTVGEIRDQVAPGVPAFERTALSMRREAAYRLAEELGRLPKPVADVVKAKARGDGWRKISRELPGRVWFSLAEDLRSGCRKLAARCGPEVRELAYLAV